MNPDWRNEPATEKQKEKLRFFGCTWDDGITAGQANDALEECATHWPDAEAAYRNRTVARDPVRNVAPIQAQPAKGFKERVELPNMANENSTKLFQSAPDPPAPSPGDTQAIQEQIANLKSHDRYIRKKAALVLGQSASEIAVKPLIESLSDSWWEVQMQAAASLGKIQSREAVEPLTGMLKVHYFELRTTAVEALGKIGDARALKALNLIMCDRVEMVRQAAVVALDQIAARNIRASSAGVTDENQPVAAQPPAKQLKQDCPPAGKPGPTSSSDQQKRERIRVEAAKPAAMRQAEKPSAKPENAPVFIPPTSEQFAEIRSFGKVPPAGLTYQEAAIWIEQCKILCPTRTHDLGPPKQDPTQNEMALGASPRAYGDTPPNQTESGTMSLANPERSVRREGFFWRDDDEPPTSAPQNNKGALPPKSKLTYEEVRRMSQEEWYRWIALHGYYGTEPGCELTFGIAKGMSAKEWEDWKNRQSQGLQRNVLSHEVTIQEAGKPQDSLHENSSSRGTPRRNMRGASRRFGNEPPNESRCRLSSLRKVWTLFYSEANRALAANGGPLDYVFDSVLPAIGAITIGLCRQIANMIEAKGYCVEPDARFGSGTYDRNQTLGLFKPLAGDSVQPSAAYVGAANLLRLCVLVATADGRIDVGELEVFREAIQNLSGLSPTDHKRLIILEQLLAQELCPASNAVARIAKSISPNERLMVGKLPG